MIPGICEGGSFGPAKKKIGTVIKNLLIFMVILLHVYVLDQQFLGQTLTKKFKNLKSNRLANNHWHLSVMMYSAMSLHKYLEKLLFFSP